MTGNVKQTIVGAACLQFCTVQRLRKWHVPAVLVLLVSVLASFSIAGETTSWTVSALAEKILEAQARFAQMRIEYTITNMFYDDSNSAGSHVVTSTYAQKMANGSSAACRYLNYTACTTDPCSGEKQIIDNGLSSFNGQRTTLVFNRKPESGKPMEGYILSGYDPNHFPSYYMDPYTRVWCYGRKPIGELLREHPDKFSIEQTSEPLNGLSTVRVTGTIAEGKLTLRLWICPDRNFLPLKVQVLVTGGRMLSEVALYDLKQLSENLWYPMTIRSPAEPPAVANPKLIIIHRISSISLEPIPDDFFAPQFPPNTHVIDDVQKTTYTTY